MALTKESLVNEIHRRIGFSKGKSRQALETLLEIIKSTLDSGGDVLISGFGKFMVKEKDARKGRNPQTKEELILRARRVVVFKTSGVLRSKINSK